MTTEDIVAIGIFMTIITTVICITVYNLGVAVCVN